MSPLHEPEDIVQTTALTFAQAGARLGVGERTVRRLVAAGRMSCVRVFSARRIRLTEIRRYLDEQDRDELAPRRRRSAAPDSAGPEPGPPPAGRRKVAAHWLDNQRA